MLTDLRNTILKQSGDLLLTIGCSNDYPVSDSALNTQQLNSSVQKYQDELDTLELQVLKAISHAKEQININKSSSVQTPTQQQRSAVDNSTLAKPESNFKEQSNNSISNTDDLFGTNDTREPSEQAKSPEQNGSSNDLQSQVQQQAPPQSQHSGSSNQQEQPQAPEDKSNDLSYVDLKDPVNEATSGNSNAAVPDSDQTPNPAPAATSNQDPNSSQDPMSNQGPNLAQASNPTQGPASGQDPNEPAFSSLDDFDYYKMNKDLDVFNANQDVDGLGMLDNEFF